MSTTPTYDRILTFLKDRQERILSGKINCIPFNLPRFSNFLPGIEQGKYYLVTANQKVGKCFGKGTKIRMYNGTIKTVENIQNNELLLGPDSLPRIVTGKTKGIDKLYQIKQKYGDDFVVNEAHILYLAKVHPYSTSSYRGKVTSIRDRWYEYITMTVKDYMLLTPKQKLTYKMVQSNTVHFNNNPTLPIDPYFYGLWLGDGDTAFPTITTIDKEIVKYLQEFSKKNNLSITQYDTIRYNLKTIPLLIGNDVDNNIISSSATIPVKGNEACYISRATKNGKIVNSLTWHWERCKGDFYRLFQKVSNYNKDNINTDYLYSSVEDRYKLLAGLLDSDGHKLKHKTTYEITLKQESLIKDVRNLAQSLGLRAYYSPKIVNEVTYYRLYIMGHNCQNIPTLISRKQCTNINNPFINELTRNFTIDSIGDGEYYGFTVDKDNLFLLEDYTIVHNTQIADWLFLYTPLLYAYQNSQNLRLKIIYFTLEMSEDEKYLQCLSFLLYTISKGKIRLAPAELRSVRQAVDSTVLDTLQLPIYKSVISFFEQNVIFVDSIRNPTGINMFLTNFAKERGVVKNKKVQFTDPITKLKYDQEVFDHFIPYDPDEYFICIIDHISLISTEKGMDLRNSMGKLSSEYIVKLRNRYKFTFAVVQQQAQAQESMENLKFNRLKPTADGLSDNKQTIRDVNLCIGLYTPFRYSIKEYEGYDITRFKDNIRFLEIIAGREGGGGNICPLYFDGAVNYFRELPLPTDNGGLQQIYNLISHIQAPQRVINLIIKINESISISQKWLWKNNKYRKSTFFRFRRFKS